MAKDVTQQDAANAETSIHVYLWEKHIYECFSLPEFSTDLYYSIIWCLQRNGIQDIGRLCSHSLANSIAPPWSLIKNKRYMVKNHGVAVRFPPRAVCTRISLKCRSLGPVWNWFLVGNWAKLSLGEHLKHMDKQRTLGTTPSSILLLTFKCLRYLFVFTEEPCGISLVH